MGLEWFPDAISISGMGLEWFPDAISISEMGLEWFTDAIPVSGLNYLRKRIKLRLFNSFKTMIEKAIQYKERGICFYSKGDISNKAIVFIHGNSLNSKIFGIPYLRNIRLVDILNWKKSKI